MELLRKGNLSIRYSFSSYWKTHFQNKTVTSRYLWPLWANRWLFKVSLPSPIRGVGLCRAQQVPHTGSSLTCCALASLVLGPQKLTGQPLGCIHIPQANETLSRCLLRAWASLELTLLLPGCLAQLVLHGATHCFLGKGAGEAEGLPLLTCHRNMCFCLLLSQSAPALTWGACVA